MFIIDGGNSGGEGPWLTWSARGSQDGTIPAKSFYLRDSNGKTVYDATQGMVLDIDAMKTGWQRSDGIVGQAPEWRWNPTVSQMQPSPGDDWKKGFEVRVAIGQGQTASWQQAGAAAWNALMRMAPSLQQREGNKLPLVKLTGTHAVQFKRGSTVEPILEVVQWVDRPASLTEGVAAGIAAEPAPAPQPVPQPAPAAPAPAAASVPDDVAF